MTKNSNNKVIMKEYKLLNVNARKKTFKSIKDLKDFIEEKDLKPNDISDSIKYNIVNTTTRSIKVGVGTVSDAKAIELLKAMKTRLANGELQGSTDMYYSYRMERYLKHPVLNKLYEILLKNDYPKEGFPRDTWYTWKPTIKKSMEEFIDYLIENFTTLDLKMVKQMTDYRPCHGYGIDFSGGYLFLREGGVMFDSFSVYGRNVHSRGMTILTDKDVDKLLK